MGPVLQEDGNARQAALYIPFALSATFHTPPLERPTTWAHSLGISSREVVRIVGESPLVYTSTHLLTCVLTHLLTCLHN